MKINAVITVRYNSKRLPGKALLNIKGKPMLQHIVDRAKASKVDDVIVATTYQSPQIREYCEEHEIKNVVLAIEGDLIGRLLRVVTNYPCDALVRIWGDCPLIDAENINRHIDLLSNYDYVFDYMDMKGKAVSIITSKLIWNLWTELQTLKEWENFHTIILQNPEKYNALILGKPYDDTTPNCSVDTQEDLEKVEKMI